MRAAWVPTTPPPSTTTLAGRTPGTPPISTPLSAGRAPQCNRRGLDGQAAGNLAHRRKQRQTAIRIGDGLVGDGRRAGCHQTAGLIRIGCEMKIGEQNLVRLEPAILDRLRFLDLDDHFGRPANTASAVGRMRAPAFA